MAPLPSVCRTKAAFTGQGSSPAPLRQMPGPAVTPGKSAPGAIKAVTGTVPTRGKLCL